MVINTSCYKNDIVVNETRKTVEANAGVDLWELVDPVVGHGLAQPYMPYKGGVSITRVITMGAHNSERSSSGTGPCTRIVVLSRWS